jgi:serine/threonine protein kinase
MAQPSDDLIIGALARRLDLVSPEGLRQAVEKRSANPARSLDDILGEMGLLAEEIRQALAELTNSLRNRISESLLSEARSLDKSDWADRSQDENRVYRPAADGIGEADDTIDPFAPPFSSPEETVSRASDAFGSTAEHVDSTIPHDNEEDTASFWSNRRADQATHATEPPVCLSAEQRYRLIRPMARGGLGQVLLARDETFGREVALKQILTRLDDDVRMQRHFLFEARITGNLEHPGIVGVYAIGRDPDGRPFYVMRLIRGETLRDAIRRYHGGEPSKRSDGARTLALSKLINRLIAVCNAVAFAHSRGVLHRDIKPANIMIGKFGETLVVDWGLAKRVDRFVEHEDQRPEEFDLTQNATTSMIESGMVVGTPAYMSPEQAEGRQDLMEPTSDVYSLGASLYEILTGDVPMRGKNVRDILTAVRAGQFPAPSEVNPAVDPALEAICLMAMAHAPEDRYATARALADDLERWLADQPVIAYREPVTKAVSRWLSRHPHVLIRGLIAIVACLVLAISAIILPRLWR